MFPLTSTPNGATNNSAVHIGDEGDFFRDGYCMVILDKRYWRWFADLVRTEERMGCTADPLHIKFHLNGKPTLLAQAIKPSQRASICIASMQSAAQFTDDIYNIESLLSYEQNIWRSLRLQLRWYTRNTRFWRYEVIKGPACRLHSNLRTLQ